MITNIAYQSEEDGADDSTAISSGDEDGGALVRKLQKELSQLRGKNQGGGTNPSRQKESRGKGK